MSLSDRRSINKVILGGLVSMAVALIVQVIGGLVYAGRLDERVSNIERASVEADQLSKKVIINSVNIEKIAESQTRVLNSLDRLNENQRRIEIKLERAIK